MLGHDRQSIRELVGTSARTRIIEGGDEVSLSSRLYALKDEVPIGMQVRQGDSGVVMAQRGTEDRRDGELCGDSSDDLDVDTVGAHLQSRGGHRVDGRVATTHEGHIAAVPGGLDSGLSALLFGAHLGGQDCGPWAHQIPYLADIRGVTSDERSIADGLDGARSQQITGARSEPNHRQMAMCRDAADGAGSVRGFGLMYQQLGPLTQHRGLTDARCPDLPGDDVGRCRDIVGGQSLGGLSAIFHTELVSQLHQTKLAGLNLVGHQAGHRTESQAVILQSLNEELTQRLDLGALVASHPND